MSIEMPFASLMDELVKLGAITDQQAQESLDRLDRAKTTPGQVARYGVLGAMTAPAIGMVGAALKGGTRYGSGGGGGVKGFARHVASDAAAGALSAGAIPLARQALDRGAERKTLTKYLAQDPQVPPSSSVSP